MEKLTGEQIIEILKKSDIELKEFAYGDFDSNALGLGEWEEVDQKGGEGEGESWHSVKHFKDHDVYLRIDGHYTSYDGTDFYGSEIEEVKPKQKTITVYE